MRDRLSDSAFSTFEPWEASLIHWNSFMKSFSLLVFVCLGAAWAQNSTPPPPASALPNLPDPTVIAVFPDGAKFTMGELKSLYPALPPQLQQAVVRDPGEFFRQYAVWRKFTAIAEEKKLDKQAPYDEALAFSRMFILYQAVLEDIFNHSTVQPAELLSYYEGHKENYKEVHVKAIYITFTDDAGSEDKAKAKATKLAASLKGGGDFVKAVKEDSEDETSKAKDGDFATLRSSDNVPDAIRKVVFSMKQGDISDPVRQPHGFYIFRAEEVTYTPYSKVRDQIFAQLKQTNAKEEIDKMDREVKVEFPNPAFPPPKPGASVPVFNTNK
jgi:peptidyl-prolyl cis-trans isomerase C